MRSSRSEHVLLALGVRRATAANRVQRVAAPTGNTLLFFETLVHGSGVRPEAGTGLGTGLNTDAVQRTASVLLTLAIDAAAARRP